MITFVSWSCYSVMSYVILLCLVLGWKSIVFAILLYILFELLFSSIYQFISMFPYLNFFILMKLFLNCLFHVCWYTVDPVFVYVNDLFHYDILTLSGRIGPFFNFYPHTTPRHIEMQLWWPFWKVRFGG